MTAKTTETKMTESDFEAHLSKLYKALEGAGDMIHYLEKCNPRGSFRTRMPMPLVSDGIVASGSGGIIIVQPDLACHPRHIVLTEETASSFELADFKIAATSNIASGGMLPLEPFSVKYYAENEKLFNIQEWDLPTVSPGMRIQLAVHNKSDKPCAFRGILWANTGYVHA
jgi:hypothetical protein